MRVVTVTIFFLGYILVGVGGGEVASANPGLDNPRSPSYVPKSLRPRVDFWRDIFAKYGKNEVVIHHRDYPWVVFNVFDFREEANSLNPVALDSLKRRKVKEYIQAIYASLKELSKGKTSGNEISRLVEGRMKMIPGDKEKYKRAIQDDLIRSQTGIRDKFIDAVRRSGRYLPFMERIFVNDFGLPIELTRLPFVESSFDYMAYSSAGAAGIWQFMPRTARNYMRVDSAVDERRDPLESTRAAARYLLSAYRSLGSWPLAVTSYNHGVVGVMRKVKKMGTSDIGALIEHPRERVFGFASNNFYPSFLAAVEVYEERHINFPEAKLEPPLHLREFMLPNAMSARYAAKQVGVDLAVLKEVNYALSSKVWDGVAKIPAGYALKVPDGYSARLTQLQVPEPKVQAVAPPASSVYGGMVYKVRQGDNLSKISKKYGVSVTNLKQLNHLENTNLRVGQVLILKERETVKQREESLISSGHVQPPRNRTYKVKSGDSLWLIAKKFEVTVEGLKEENNFRSTKLKAGQILKVP